eukprot:2924112-Amphidinium_carterae.1
MAFKKTSTVTMHIEERDRQINAFPIRRSAGPCDTYVGCFVQASDSPGADISDRTDSIQRRMQVVAFKAGPSRD